MSGMISQSSVLKRLPKPLAHRITPWTGWNAYESAIKEAYEWFGDYVKRRKVSAVQPAPPAGMHWVYTPFATLSGVTAVTTARRNGLYAAHFDDDTGDWVVDHLPTGRVVDNGLDKEATFALVDELAETHSHFLEDGTYAVDPKQFHTPAAIALMHDIIAYTRSLATKPDNVREYTTVGDYVYQMLSKRKHSGKTTVKFAVKKKHDNFEHDVAPIELVFDGQWAIKIYPRNESIALRNFLNRSRYVLKDDIAPVNV